MRLSQILENVVRGKFEQRLRSKRGMYKHPDIDVPPGYDRFEAHRTNYGGKIVGFKGERSFVVSTTGSFELADALASAYNAGGYTDKKIERVPLSDFFK